MSVDDFLLFLYEEYGQRMLDVLERQVSRYKKPPKTINALLDILESHGHKKFAANIRFHEKRDEAISVLRTTLQCYGRSNGQESYLEGTKCRVWSQGSYILITAKDGRGEIFYANNQKISSQLKSEDIEKIKVFVSLAKRTVKH